MLFFNRWRRRRILRHRRIPDSRWRELLRQAPLVARHSEADQARLRDLATLFLHEKRLSGAAGLELTDAMRLSIAAQACIPVLNLGLDCYKGWVSLIVYPGEFLVRHEYTDEAGLVHETEDALSGESWQRGPMVLSWEDVEEGGRPDAEQNVVVHECAHKLDALDGVVNGMPPLHHDMPRKAWTAAFTEAFADFQRRVDHGRDLPLDQYAAEDPGEFFAVMSEEFFLRPSALREAYPAVYDQMRGFYRQDPA